jgi:mannose-P-dolichol utilization defect 1
MLSPHVSLSEDGFLIVPIPLFQVFNYLAGSLSRIFTTLQEVDDKLILYGFVAGFSLNAVLAAQMVYYWNAPAPKIQKKRE